MLIHSRNEQAKADEAAEPRGALSRLLPPLFNHGSSLTRPAAVTTGKLIPLRLDTSSTVTIKGVVARIAADSPTSGLFALVNCAMVVHAGAVDWLQARDIQHVMEVRDLAICWPPWHSILMMHVCGGCR